MPDEQDKLEYEHRKNRYEAYLSERDALRHDSLEVSGRYDRAILALAGGALALSITFLEKIAPHPPPWTFVLLGLSWACLIASVLLELYALSTSQTATNEQIGLANEDYRRFLLSLPEQTPLPDPIRQPESQLVIEGLKDRTRRFNDFSRWLLTGGLVLLCLFSLVNLPASTTPTSMNKEKGTTAPARTTPPPPRGPLNESRGSYVAPSNALPPPPPPKPAAPPTPPPKK